MVNENGKPVPFLNSRLTSNVDVDDSQLVHISYVSIADNSPELSTKYDNIPLNIEMNISNIYINVVNEEVIRVVSFLSTAFVLDSSESVSTNSLPAAPEPSSSNTVVTAEGVSKTTGVMRFQFNFKALATKIACRGGEVAELVVAGAYFGLNILNDGTLDATGSLAQCTLKDLSCQDSAYDTILDFESEQVFQFRVKVIPERLWALKKCSVDLTLSVSGIKFVFLNRFVSLLSAYGTAFSSSLGSSSASHSDAAKGGEKKAVESNAVFDSSKMFKMKMRIDVKAPTICIPESSYSGRLLEVDLGKIKITNSFSEDQRSPVEVISLSLTEVIVRARGYGQARDIDIVKKIDSSVEVCRSLRPGIHEIPDLKVSSTMAFAMIE